MDSVLTISDLPFETGTSYHNRVTDETSLYRTPWEGRLYLWNEACMQSKTGRSYRQMWKINANGQLNALLRINICNAPMKPDKASELFFPFFKNFMLHILTLFCSFLNSFQILPHLHTHPTSYSFFPLKKQKQQRNTHTKKIMESDLCLVNYFWAWGLFWSAADIPSDAPLKKADFPAPKAYEIEIAS